MPSELVMSSFGGVIVGAIGAVLMVLLCVAARYADEVIEYYRWLASEMVEISRAHYRGRVFAQGERNADNDSIYIRS